MYATDPPKGFDMLKYVLPFFLCVAAAAACGDTSRSASVASTEAGIYDGDIAVRPSFMVSLQRNEPGDDLRTVNCGGTLVAPNWVLTAAHCVHRTRGGIFGFPLIWEPRPLDSFSVLIGKNPLSDPDGPGTERFSVTGYFVHPDSPLFAGGFADEWDNFLGPNFCGWTDNSCSLSADGKISFARDLALVRLDGNSSYKPATCENGPLADGTPGRAMGWGWFERNSGPADHLLDAQLQTADPQICEDSLNNTPSLICWGGFDTTSQLCLVSADPDRPDWGAGPGDSGGPWLPKKYAVAGVASIAATGPTGMSIYAKTEGACSWVDSTIKNNPVFTYACGECFTDADCDLGEVCEAGGPSCESTVCVPGCRDDSDCGKSELCRRVECVTCPCPPECISVYAHEDVSLQEVFDGDRP